jgi:hypothetical protein
VAAYKEPLTLTLSPSDGERESTVKSLLLHTPIK